MFPFHVVQKTLKIAKAKQNTVKIFLTAILKPEV